MRKKFRIDLIFALACLGGTASASDREDACLLGQETAALFYSLIEKDPERAERLLREVDTRIAKRAYYWATAYREKEKTLHDLATDYLVICLKTGPGTLPAPQF